MHGAQAALCLECGRESGAIVTSRKAGCWVTLSAHGVPAHAGTSPDEGRSALRAMARELLRIEGELHGSRPGMTAVATQLHAGEVKNTVPDEAWGIDRRAGARRRRPRLRARAHPRSRRARRASSSRSATTAASRPCGARPSSPAPRCASSRRTASRRSRRPPAASPTAPGRATSACRRSTASGRWAATTTPSTSGSSSASVGPRVEAIVALCEGDHANVMTPRPGAPARRSS